MTLPEVSFLSFLWFFLYPIAITQIAQGIPLAPQFPFRTHRATSVALTLSLLALRTVYRSPGFRVSFSQLVPILGPAIIS